MIRLNKVAIRDALRSANLLTKTSEEKLCEAVGETISFWIPEKLDFLPIRGQHNHLKGIWKLVHDADPPIALIRSRFKKLPYSSRFYLRRRASLL